MDTDLRKRLENAAEKVAAEARLISSGLSTKIPASIKVVSDRSGVSVVQDATIAPSGPPLEFGLRHPLFGNRDKWYRDPKRPFMAPAVARKQNEAEDEIANVVDDWAQEGGFR